MFTGLSTLYFFDALYLDLTELLLIQKAGGVILKEEDVAVSNVKIDMTRGRKNPLEWYSWECRIIMNSLCIYSDLFMDFLLIISFNECYFFPVCICFLKQHQFFRGTISPYSIMPHLFAFYYVLFKFD